MARILLLIFAMTLIQSCANEPKDLKSPCVGAEKSPCDRRPVNQDMG